MEAASFAERSGAKDKADSAAEGNAQKRKSIQSRMLLQK